MKPLPSSTSGSLRRVVRGSVGDRCAPGQDRAGATDPARHPRRRRAGSTCSGGRCVTRRRARSSSAPATTGRPIGRGHRCGRRPGRRLDRPGTIRSEPDHVEAIAGQAGRGAPRARPLGVAGAHAATIVDRCWAPAGSSAVLCVRGKLAERWGSSTPRHDPWVAVRDCARSS